MIRLLLWAIASSQPPSSSSFKKIQIFTVLCTSVALYRVDGVNTLEDDELQPLVNYTAVSDCTVVNDRFCSSKHHFTAPVVFYALPKNYQIFFEIIAKLVLLLLLLSLKCLLWVHLSTLLMVSNEVCKSLISQLCRGSFNHSFCAKTEKLLPFCIMLYTSKHMLLLVKRSRATESFEWLICSPLCWGLPILSMMPDRARGRAQRDSS